MSGGSECVTSTVENVRCGVLWIPPVIVHMLLLWSYYTFNFVLLEGMAQSSIIRGALDTKTHPQKKASCELQSSQCRAAPTGGKRRCVSSSRERTQGAARDSRRACRPVVCALRGEEA